MQRSVTWDQCLALMPATLLARELLQSYKDLEDLYWQRTAIWVAAQFSKKAKKAFNVVQIRILEKKVEIKQLGGKVPPFWSIA